VIRFRGRAWEEVRARGLRAFVLRYGVLQRGVPLGVFVAVLLEIGLGHPLPDAFWTPAFAGRLLLGVVVFSLSGSISARMIWNATERRFLRERGEG
jgi:hypothetical protein